MTYKSYGTTHSVSPNLVQRIFGAKDLKLNIIGTMCIPPDNQDPKPFFKEMLNLNNKFNLPEISMGMTNDFLEAVEFKSTYLRIGTGIFGKRSI